MGNQIIPWDQIRSEYVTGNTSYRRLAKKYGVSFGDVCRHGRDEGWVELQKQHRSDLVAKIEEDAKERGLAALRRSGRIAELALDRAEELLGEPGGLNGTQLEAAVGALRSAVAIVRDVYGILTEAERARIDNDREKLALEKARLELRDDDARGEIVIQVLGEDAEDYGI